MVGKDFANSIISSDLGDIFGQEKVKRQLKSALLSERHIILVGQPGIGKTTLAKNIAKILPEKKLSYCEFHCPPESPVCPKCRKKKEKKQKLKSKEYRGQELFVRIQGSPDLTAEDLIGDIDPVKAIKFGPLSVEAFTPGKIFRANQGILFFDEINRCSEKLQNSLLQVLEEKKVTIGSYVMDFPADFIFIGTMNPDDTSTEPLSDVFMDRFDLIEMHHPESLEIETRIVREKGKDMAEFPEDILARVINFVRSLREDDNIDRKPSVRASIGIYERAQANALVHKRERVIQEDIAEVIVSVLSHRMSLKPSVKYLQRVEDYVSNKYEQLSEEIAEASDYL